MSLSLQLQQSDLRLERATWTAKSTRTGFSVSLFWPIADHNATELKQNKKKRRRNKRKAKATINLNSNKVAVSAPGSCVSTPNNANPVASESKVDTHSLSPQCESDADCSVAWPREPDEDDPSNSNSKLMRQPLIQMPVVRLLIIKMVIHMV